MEHPIFLTTEMDSVKNFAFRYVINVRIHVITVINNSIIICPNDL